MGTSYKRDYYKIKMGPYICAPSFEHSPHFNIYFWYVGPNLQITQNQPMRSSPHPYQDGSLGCVVSLIKICLHKVCVIIIKVFNMSAPTLDEVAAINIIGIFSFF